MVTQYTLDEVGNRIEVIQAAGTALGRTVKYEYDALNRLVVTADPLGHETEFSYNYLGNTISQTDANWNVTTFDYDVNGRLTAKTNAESNTTEYDYDYIGNRTRLTDPRGNWTDFSYNQFNELIGITYADSSSESYVYDAAGLKRQKTTRAGETIIYDYDEFGRLTNKTYPDSSTADFSYDQLGRMTAASNDSASYDFSYNDLNQLVEVDFTIGSEAYKIAYTHDLVGNKTSLEYPSGETYTREYDDLNRLTQVKKGEDVLAEHNYNNLNQRIRRDYLNSTWSSYSYNDAGWLTALVNWRTETDVISEFSYTHDDVGNRTSMTTEDGTHDYSYDKISELTSVDYPAGSSFSDQTFHYDAAFNRTTTVNGGEREYFSNELNQYTEVAGVSFAYDLNGNLTTDGIQTYYYDCENQLTKVVRNSDGATLGEYKYDPFGKRIQKITDDATTNYVYDQESYQVLAEDEDDGGGFELAREFVYGVGIGIGIDEPLVMVQDEEQYFYYRDGLGSVVGLTNSDEDTVKSYDYAVYGDFTASSALSGNPYTFTGRSYDPESGLFYYRARYYNAEFGRFLQVDPIGYVTGPNLFSYVANNPINLVDPLGLMAPRPETSPPGPIYIPADSNWTDNLNNNCYNYACDRPCGSPVNPCDPTSPTTPGYWQPGETVPGIPPLHPDPDSNINCSTIMSRVSQERMAKNPDSHGCCPLRYHKIRVWVDPSRDFHFFRQNRDGNWSDKSGQCDAQPRRDPSSYRPTGRDYQHCGDLCIPN